MKHDTLQQEFTQYWKQTEPYFVCSSKERQKFRGEAYQSVLAFFSDCPAEERPSVASYLGDPEDLAATFLETLDHEEIQKTHRKNKRRTRIALIVGGFCLLVGGVLTYLYHNPPLFTVHEQTIIYPEQKISDEDIELPRGDGTWTINPETNEWEKISDETAVWDEQKGEWVEQ